MILTDCPHRLGSKAAHHDASIYQSHIGQETERKRKIQGPISHPKSFSEASLVRLDHFSLDLLRHQSPQPVISLHLYLSGDQPFTHHAFGDISDSDCSRRCQLQILLLQRPSSPSTRSHCFWLFIVFVFVLRGWRQSLFSHRIL